jgi:hypothetical protein
MKLQFSLARLLVCTGILAVVAAISATVEVHNEHFIADGEFYRAPFAGEVLGRMAVWGPIALATFLLGRWGAVKFVRFWRNYDSFTKKPQAAAVCMFIGVISGVLAFTIRGGPCSEPIVLVSPLLLLVLCGAAIGVGLGMLVCKAIEHVALCGVLGVPIVPLIVIVLANSL